MLTSPPGSLCPLLLCFLSVPSSRPFSLFPACSVTGETDHCGLITGKEDTGDLGQLLTEYSLWEALEGGFGGRRAGGIFSLAPSLPLSELSMEFCVLLGLSTSLLLTLALSWADKD